MKLFVRPADLDTERPQLIEVLQRNLPDFDHAARFEWLYRQNPAGAGRAWFACSVDPDRVIGAASLLPKLFWVRGQLVLGAQVGDFAVDSAHRSLGPALLLQKATMSPVDQGDFAFCYDCPPHDRGMATFVRLGLAPVCRMARFARLLRADEAVRKRVPGGPIVHAPVSLVANILLSLFTRARSVRGLDIEKLDEDFGEEFSALDASVAAADSDRGFARARLHSNDLNWRFRRHPSWEYDVLTVRRTGELVGFVVYRRYQTRARVYDALAKSEEIFGVLLQSAAEDAFCQGASTIDLLGVHPSREASLAAAAGYSYREPAERVVVHSSHLHVAKLVPPIVWKLDAADIMA